MTRKTYNSNSLEFQCIIDRVYLCRQCRYLHISTHIYTLPPVSVSRRGWCRCHGSAVTRDRWVTAWQVTECGRQGGIFSFAMLINIDPIHYSLKRAFTKIYRASTSWKRIHYAEQAPKHGEKVWNFGPLRCALAGAFSVIVKSLQTLVSSSTTHTIMFHPNWLKIKHCIVTQDALTIVRWRLGFYLVDTLFQHSTPLHLPPPWWVECAGRGGGDKMILPSWAAWPSAAQPVHSCTAPSPGTCPTVTIYIPHVPADWS